MSALRLTETAIARSVGRPAAVKPRTLIVPCLVTQYHRPTSAPEEPADEAPQAGDQHREEERAGIKRLGRRRQGLRIRLPGSEPRLEVLGKGGGEPVRDV